MKKASTWYSVVLAIFNVGIALGTSSTTALWLKVYNKLNVRLPGVTLLALSSHFYWWPYLFVGLAILLALVSVFSRWPSSSFYPIIIIVLILECFLLYVGPLILALRLFNDVMPGQGGMMFTP